jgi:hypothetical protein
MMDVQMAWREERAVALALAGVYRSVQIEPPVVLWRKQPPEHATRFLLDAKRSRSVFPLSELGRVYLNSVDGVNLPLRYVIDVDRFIQVPATHDVFAALCAEGWLAMWHPLALLSYFAGRPTATLVLVQTRELPEEVDVHVLDRERGAGNFFCALTRSLKVPEGRSVVPVNRFAERRSRFLQFLSEHGWVVSEETTSSTIEDVETLF